MKKYQELKPRQRVQTPAQSNTTQSRMSSLMEKQLNWLPVASNIRLFWQNAQELRAWWPILIPLLIWIGWRTYHEERRKIIRESQKT